jgi:hypothetical protein
MPARHGARQRKFARNQQSGATAVAQSGRVVADMVRRAVRLQRVKKE